MIYRVMKTTFERDPLMLINDLARLLRTRADARARAFGMTLAQWKILVRLEAQPGVSQNELAALIEVEPITVARLVDRLETRGFVERRADPSDRRIWRLHVTPAAAPIPSAARTAGASSPPAPAATPSRARRARATATTSSPSPITAPASGATATPLTKAASRSTLRARTLEEKALVTRRNGSR